MEPSKKLSVREITRAIRERILDGTYKTGSVLPAQPVFDAEFNASTSSINNAMRALAAEGLVHPKQGRGTIVTWLPPMVHSADRYSRAARERNGAKGAFDAEIRALGLEPQHQITVEHAEPPLMVAEKLGVPVGEVSCLVRRRRLLVSGIPNRLNETWVPLEIAADTVFEEEGPVIVGGVKSAFADLGYPQTGAKERVTVRLPTDHEVYALEISPERNVYEIVHVAHTADGRAVEVTVTVTPANYLIIESDIDLT
jgi:GntR family transcriptional regulator